MVRSADKTGIILAACALAPTLIVGYIASQQTSKMHSANGYILHKQEIHQQLDELLLTIKDVEGSMRGYVITGKEEFLRPYLEVSPKINEFEARLSRAIADQPEQKKLMAQLDPLIDEKVENMAQIVMLRQKQGFDAAADVVSVGEGRILMEKIWKLIAQMQVVEDEIKPDGASDAAVDQHSMMRVSIILTLFALSLVGCNVFFLKLR